MFPRKLLINRDSIFFFPPSSSYQILFFRTRSTMESSIPTPPYEEHHGHPGRPQGSRKTHPSSKAAKPVHRASKRASTHPHSHPSPPHHDGHIMTDGRHKRVWKACERCRMKKTKVRTSSPLRLRLCAAFLCLLICRLSVMESFPVNGVKTTVWCVQQGHARRWSISSCPKGKCRH